MTTVVVVEDHDIVRKGFIALLQKQKGFKVVGETGNGTEALELIEALEPDILLIDLTIPGLHGLKVIHQVKHRSPDTQVIVLSMHDQKAYIVAAFRSGADAYIAKDDTDEHLFAAVERVLADEQFISPVLPLSLEEMCEEVKDKTRLAETLTPREEEIIRYIADGNTTGEIAQKLAISPRTVETHRRNIMKKLELENVNQVVRYALEHGLVPRGG